MRSSVGPLAALLLAGCANFGELSVSGDRPSADAGTGFRPLNPAAVRELAAAFRLDPAAAKAKYTNVRWRFPGTVVTAASTTATVAVDGVGDCAVSWRAGATAAAAKLEPGRATEFAGYVEAFDPAAVGGVRFVEAEPVSRKVRGPKADVWVSPSGDS